MGSLAKCLCCEHYRVHEGCTVSCSVLGNVHMKSTCSDFEPNDYAECYMSMTNHCAHCKKKYSDGTVTCALHGDIPYRERCYDFVEDYGCVEKKKGCFLTTATCQILGKADDCDELEALRSFRDTYLQTRHPDMIEEYYRLSPRLADKLNSHEDRKKIAQLLMQKYIIQSIILIEQKRYEEAIVIYREMVCFLGKKI